MDSGVPAVVWEWVHPVHTWFSHGPSLSPKRSKHDRTDSRVSAAVWEWLDPLHTWFSHGASLSRRRPGHNRRD